MDYDNSNRGALFVNKFKKPDSKQPDYQGELYVGTKKMKLSAWEKTSGKGDVYLSVSLSEITENNYKSNSNSVDNTQQETRKALVDDKIPF
jgi:uncharacterized protein (DUF736 family)